MVTAPPNSSMRVRVCSGGRCGGGCGLDNDLVDNKGPGGVVSQLCQVSHGDLDVPMEHSGPCAGGPVHRTLRLASLLHVGQHHYRVRVCLPHHLPEVRHCLRERAWGGGGMAGYHVMQLLSMYLE